MRLDILRHVSPFFQIRSELVNKLTDVDLTDTTQAQQTVGALIEATKHKTELAPKTQVSSKFSASSLGSLNFIFPLIFPNSENF